MVTSNDCIAKYGKPDIYMERKHMTVYDIPEEINQALPTTPNRVYCNRDMVEPLENALCNIIDRDLIDELKTWDGLFNIRKKRGLNSWSLHSWGIAVDINAAWNGLGREPQMSKQLVKCFTDAGFDWGGNWRRRPDGMHFQLKAI